MSSTEKYIVLCRVQPCRKEEALCLPDIEMEVWGDLLGVLHLPQVGEALEGPGIVKQNSSGWWWGLDGLKRSLQCPLQVLLLCLAQV